MAKPYSLDDLVELDYRVLTALDPALQRISLRARQQAEQATSMAASSVEAAAPRIVPEIAVVAKVTDVQAWESSPDVQPGIVLERGSADGHDIVTGRIPADRIEDVRQQPFVVSMKAPHRLRARLDATGSDLGAAALPSASRAAGGQGVIVGVVDIGCDFVHKNFRAPDDTTRLLALWDQNASSHTAGPVKYGALHSRDDINAALPAHDPYAALQYSPAVGAHGTHVMDIAAGNGRGSGHSGVAPKADLIFVELAADKSQSTATQSVGDSVHLLEAVDFIFKQAGTRPCAVNLSLGSNTGPHDGSSLVEAGIDRLLEQQPGRQVIVAGGNAAGQGWHAMGQVTPAAPFDLQLVIPDSIGDVPGETGNDLEIWYAGQDRFDVQVLGPNGAPVLAAAAGETRAKAFGHSTALMIASRLKDPNNADNQIGIFFDKKLPSGTWTIRISGTALTGGGRFHAWLEPDNLNPASFDPSQQADSHTLESLSCGRNTIVAGAYNAHTPGGPIFFATSSGPTRDGRSKPDVSAPGVNVSAASSRTLTGVTSKSGTSMAAPAICGIAALLLAEAQAAGKSLGFAQLRDLVIASARTSPPPAGAWHPQYGNGRASASEVLTRFLAGG